MLGDGFGWIRGGGGVVDFQSFAVLVTTVTCVALDLKELNNCGKFL